MAIDIIEARKLIEELLKALEYTNNCLDYDDWQVVYHDNKELIYKVQDRVDDL